MGTKLRVNCASCDLRNVTEETLAAYDQIQVNAAVAYTNPEARRLLAKYPVALNCASQVDVDGDVKMHVINGSATLDGSQAGGGKVFLMVNGSLTITPEAGETLSRYVGGIINGSVTCPQSLSGALGTMTVNGKTTIYPDGAILLKRRASIDASFPLRARAGLYWSGKMLLFTDPKLDAEALKRKGVRFAAPEAVVLESLAEAVTELLEENTDILVVPDGTKVVDDDLTLNKSAFLRYGTRMLVLGDVTLEEKSREILPKIQYLMVRGDVTLPEELEEDFARVGAEYGELHVLRGRVVRDKDKVRVTAWMLSDRALTVEDCDEVELDETLTPELILERLVIRDCEAVLCTPEQAAAVTLIAEDVDHIGGKKAKEPVHRDENTVVINTVNYTF